MNRVFTGNYYECKAGNLISISKDKGEDAGFSGKAMLEFAPQKEFFKKWKNNIGVIPDEENNRYYINEYYKRILSKINVEELLKDEKDPILLCYEKGQAFCHRHVLAEYIELLYGTKVRDIKIDEKHNIEENERPAYIKPMLERVILENILVPDQEIIDEQYLEKNKKLLFKIIPELSTEDGFDQKSPWHSYDVWGHTKVALSNSDPDLESRICLLLHDIGKPHSCQEDGDVRHFKGHAEKSAEMAEKIFKRLGYNEFQITRMCYLIENHSTPINPESITAENIEILKKLLGIQYCDAKAYNPEKIEKALNQLDKIKKKVEQQEKNIDESEGYAL